MKMIFSRHKYIDEMDKHGIPTNDFAIVWYDKIDGKVVEFHGESPVSSVCEFIVHRDWCEPFEEKTAEQMFAELGYEKEVRGQYVEFCKTTVSDIGRSARKIVIFNTKKKAVETYDSGVEDCIAVDRELLNAIVKQFDEFGW